MYSENNCAASIRLVEGEEFLAVARRVYSFFDAEDQIDARKLPDLISVKREGDKTYYRIREIKFKLEERLIVKAINQLKMGAECLLKKDPNAQIDRLELVIALEGRKLKEDEEKFIGNALGGMRYQLVIDDKTAEFVLNQIKYDVTLLFS